MKKIIGIGCILILMLSLTACISDDERDKGKENVKVGQKLIKEYVRETYGKKAKVSDLKPIYKRGKYDSTVPSFTKIASGFVKATVTTKDSKFDILYNVNTKNVLTQENISAVQDSFLTYANDVLQSGNLVDCEMILYSEKIDDHYISSFIEPDITTYEELIATGEYKIELTYRSINSDFDNISEENWQQLISSFSGEGTEHKVYMLFVNYKDKESYKAEADQNYYRYIEKPYYETEEAIEYTKDILYINSEGFIQVVN